MAFSFLTPGYNPTASAPGALGIDPRLANLLDYQSPVGQGLLQAGAALLAAGGRSREPVGLGGAIGQGLMAGSQAYNQANRSNLLSTVTGAQLSELVRKQEQRRAQEAALSSLTAGMDPQKAALMTALGPERGAATLAQEGQTKQAQDFSRETMQLQQTFSRETMGLQQDFQAKQQAYQNAFAAAQQDRSFANQSRLQQAQQDFQKAETALNRSLQQDLERQRQDAPMQMVPSPAGDGTMIPRATAESYARTQGELPAALTRQAATEGAKPMTDEQSKAAGFADRMLAAESVISNPKIATALTSRFNRAVTGDMTGVGVPFGNELAGPDYQKATQAQRSFINAVLRRESGAVISPSEFEEARKQYFPAPGDSQEVLEQKANERRIAYENMMRSAGPRYSRERAANVAPVTSAPKNIPALPEGFVIVPGQ